MRLRVASLACAIVSLATASRAFAADCGAQVSTCVDADVVWPTGGPTIFSTIPSALTIEAKRFGFGLATTVSHDPLTIRTSNESASGTVDVPVVGNLVTSTFLFSYGVTDRLQADVAAPVSFYQDGEGTARLTGTTPNLPSNVVRDVRLGLAYALLPLPRVPVLTRAIGLVARFDFSTPLGDREAFAGDRGVVFVPQLAGELHVWRLTFASSIGARFRTKEVTYGDARVASQRTLSIGAALALDPHGNVSLTAEAFSIRTFVASDASPSGWLVGMRFLPLWGGDLTVRVAAGSGFHSASDGRPFDPTWRGVLDVRYEPVAFDEDRDGVPDRVDKCPTDPEDRDGFEDADGCPDPDNDGDHIPDAIDKCPNQAENYNGFEDTDGCPEPDRDGDGIPDAIDKCPDKPEDKNGYQDDDGCPEGGPPKVICADGTVAPPGVDACDTDKDKVVDALDQCPLVPEDLDGIADDDGCPEMDADEDGVGDQVDKCPLVAETIDGKDDVDGCPEEGAKPKVHLDAGAVVVDDPVRFAKKGANVTKAMEAQLRMIAQRTQGLVDRDVEKIVILAWGDDASEAPSNAEQAQRRADAIAKTLAALGIPDALVIAKPGDLTDPPDAPKANWLVTVRTKRKAPLTKLPPGAGAP